MADIMGFMPGLGNIKVLLTYVGWFFLFFVITASICAIVIMILVKGNQKKIIEINMNTHRLRMFGGRLKKKAKGVKQFYASKIKRFLPEFQENSTYTKGKQDVVILLKDNNGMYHTAKIPTYKQIKKWYKVMYEIDLDKKENQELEKIRDIYLLPSPHEDLDWLAGQCAEADSEFKNPNWWQHPNVMIIGTAFISAMIFIMTLIITKKM